MIHAKELAKNQRIPEWHRASPHSAFTTQYSQTPCGGTNSHRSQQEVDSTNNEQVVHL